MDLFNQDIKLTNLLPKDGTVHHHGFVFSKKEAIEYYNLLLANTPWKSFEAVTYGKHIITKRKAAWYAEKGFRYTYSNTTKTGLPFTKELLDIKKRVEVETNETYNSCLLNLYHNGSEGMGWHSDDEKDIKKNGAIASVTFGAERKFAFKHKDTKEVVSMVLQSGSVLVMKDEIQTHWLHRLPPTKKVHTPRINLTFRTIVERT